MTKYAIILIVSIIALSLVFNPGIIHAKSKADKKASAAILKSIQRAVEGKTSQIGIVVLSKFSNLSNFIVAYNKTGPVTPPGPPNPPPGPPPSVNGDKVCAAGDFTDQKVFDAMKKNGCNTRVALGDLGYGSHILKGFYERCVIGNHDSDEDSKGKPIVSEAKATCNEFWWLKLGNHTLLMGFNTNGVLDPQIANAKFVISQNPGVKNIVVFSHKPICSTPPNSHHKLESSAKGLCSPLVSMAGNATLYFVNGHNHVDASTQSINDLNGGTYNTAGRGGKTAYACGTDDIWDFCDNKELGYWQMTIQNDGAAETNFMKLDGSVLH